VAALGAVTAALWYAKAGGAGADHPIFFYLLPIALVAVLYGTLPALACTAAAVLFASYFLYEPAYSFQVASPLELGELICFAVLALFTIKCTVELFRPSARIPQTKSHYRRV
jgi:K+-sensing histidine kinase KdpD